MHACRLQSLNLAIPCLSGLHIHYDMKKPSGNRVVEIKVRCAACQIPVYKPLEESAVYKVIMTSRISLGADRGLVSSAKRNCPIKEETLPTLKR